MQSDFLEFIGNARARRSDKFRNQLYIFTVCLVISFFIWGMVRLSKDYYYSVDYRLNFVRPHANLRLVSCSDSVLHFRIKIQGFEFFSEQLLVRKDRYHEVSLRNVRIRSKGELVSGYLLTSQIGKDIIAQANFPSDVYSVSPDTLFFEFEKSNIRHLDPKPASGVINSGSHTMDSLLRRSDSIVRHKNDPGHINRK